MAYAARICNMYQIVVHMLVYTVEKIPLYKCLLWFHSDSKMQFIYILETKINIRYEKRTIYIIYSIWIFAIERIQLRKL